MKHPISGAGSEKSEFREGWPLVLAGLVGTGLGVPSLMINTIGIYAPFLGETFNWSLTVIMGGIAIITLVLLTAGPIVGRIVDRHNPSRLLGISFTGLSIGYISLAFSTGSVVQYYVSWLVICVAGMGATPIAFTRLINISFDKHRGLALGIMLAGPGLVAAFLKPLAGFAIEMSGWRTAIVIVGLLPVLIALPLCRWALSRSERLMTSAPAQGHEANAGLEGFSVREAATTRAFWIIIALLIPMAVAIAALVPHLENILGRGGLSLERTVMLTTIMGLTLAFGRLACGWLMDKVWAPLVGAVSLTAAAVGCVLLALSPINFGMGIIAIALIGFAAGAEYDLLSFLVGRYFGLRHYGAIYGIVYAVFAVGAGFGPGLIGYAYDRFGTYEPVLHTCAVLLMGSAALLLALGRYPKHFDCAEKSAAEGKVHVGH